jgi:hypothetical protein
MFKISTNTIDSRPQGNNKKEDGLVEVAGIFSLIGARERY